MSQHTNASLFQVFPHDDFIDDEQFDEEEDAEADDGVVAEAWEGDVDQDQADGDTFIMDADYAPEVR